MAIPAMLVCTVTSRGLGTLTSWVSSLAVRLRHHQHESFAKGTYQGTCESDAGQGPRIPPRLEGRRCSQGQPTVTSPALRGTPHGNNRFKGMIQGRSFDEYSQPWALKKKNQEDGYSTKEKTWGGCVWGGLSGMLLVLNLSSPDQISPWFPVLPPLWLHCEHW